MADNQPQQTSDLKGQRQDRIAKIEKLREMGIDPYPSQSARTKYTDQISNEFSELEGTSQTLSGRLMSFRSHGKVSFADLQDPHGRLQLFIREQELTDTSSKKQIIGYENLNLLDVGDIVQATGEVVKTKTGEISLLVKELKILTKTIRPLPDKWEGIQDKETRYRRRYLDILMDDSKRELFIRKSKFWQVNRAILQRHGFIEVETPVLEHKTGGADARPFVTYHNDLSQNLYMRISTELAQKRLIGSGFEKVYTLGPNFRNEGLSDEHLQEYYQIEWYWAYANYQDNMDLVKEMFREIAREVYGTTKFTTRGHTFDLANEWELIDYPEIINSKLGIDIFTATEERMLKVLEDHQVKLTGEINRNRLIDNLWKVLRKDISGPAFLINEPKFMSPLAKSKPDNAKLTERFHVILAGSELGNGYTEINDPIDQLNRFTEQEQMREAGDDEAQMLDIDFVEMLEYGMPPVSGYGHSERLFWFLENIVAREGTLFPLMRYELENTTKDIYKDVLQLDDKADVDEVSTDVSKSSKLNLVSITDDVKQQFNGIRLGYVVIEGVDNSVYNKAISRLKSKSESVFKAKYDSVIDVRKTDNIAGFREIYKRFNVDPNSRMNSAEALAKRVLDGKGIYKINSVVDLYNSTSLEQLIPMAAYDLDSINSNIELRLSKAGDEIKKIGDDSVEPVSEGELVYADQAGVMCLDYNYRDSDRTRITKDTNNVIVFVDGHEDICPSYILDTLNLIAARITDNLGGKVAGYNILFDSDDALTDDSQEDYPSIEETRKLVHENVTDEYQRHHAEMVGFAMSEYAKILAEKYPNSGENFDSDLWYVTGLVHDWDYEFDPEGHPVKNIDKLTELGYPAIVTDAILSHKVDPQYPPNTKIAQALLAIDEMSGLLFAYSKLKGSYKDMKVKSVKKKFKDKSFAAKINRSDIQLGIDKLSLDNTEHFENMINIFAKFESRS